MGNNIEYYVKQITLPVLPSDNGLIMLLQREGSRRKEDEGGGARLGIVGKGRGGASEVVFVQSAKVDAVWGGGGGTKINVPKQS